jgi:hypothetical protein
MQNGNGRKKGKKEKKIGLRHSTRRLAKRDALLFVNKDDLGSGQGGQIEQTKRS